MADGRFLTRQSGARESSPVRAGGVAPGGPEPGRPGAHTEYGLAKRLVRLCKYLATTGTIYRPKALMDPDTPKAALAAYYQAAWTKLLPKWKGKADLKDVFAPDRPLGQWRNMAQELYALELRLPRQRAAAAKAGASTT